MFLFGPVLLLTEPTQPILCQPNNEEQTVLHCEHTKNTSNIDIPHNVSVHRIKSPIYPSVHYGFPSTIIAWLRELEGL